MGALVENPSVRMMHILAEHHKQGGLTGGEGHGISEVQFQIQELGYKQDVRLSKWQLELLIKQEHINHFRRAMGTSTAEEKLPYTILLLYTTAFPASLIPCAVSACPVLTC